MISYVKLQGEKRDQALETLRDLSLDIDEVCIMDKAIYSQLKKAYPIERGGFIYGPGEAMMNLDEGILTLFRGTERVGHRICHDVISKRGEDLGEHDFFFEWFETPNQKQMDDLINKIAEALKAIDMKYTIFNKN
jgi:hypothetical protein